MRSIPRFIFLFDCIIIKLTVPTIFHLINRESFPLWYLSLSESSFSINSTDLEEIKFYGLGNYGTIYMCTGWKLFKFLHLHANLKILRNNLMQEENFIEGKTVKGWYKMCIIATSKISPLIWINTFC